MDKDKYFQGYNQFVTVKNKNIQAWNRLMTFFNIANDVGLSKAREYIRSIDKEGRAKIKEIKEHIEKVGHAEAHRQMVGRTYGG